MSLRTYRWPRLVVLNPRASAREAARAMENNAIGTVLVQDGGRVVGIVTDRDLATRVVGHGRDGDATPLSEVMSRDVAALSPDASRMDAIRLMQERNVRRVPLVEADRIVGIVTLDDLLLDEAAPLDELGAIVRAQLGQGGPAAPRRRRAREARAEGTYWRLINELRANASLETTAEAEVALEVALTSLLRRLTPHEANDLIAQLPSLLHAQLQRLPDGPDRSVTRAAIEDQLMQRLEIDRPRATDILNAVGRTLEQNVSPGQIEDVRGQLPEELRSVFSGPPSRVP